MEPGCQAEVTETGDIRISVGAEAPSTVGAQLDPIQLSIFSHRFMSIAGEWLSPPCSLLLWGGGFAHWAEACAGGMLGRGVERMCDLGKGAEAESLLRRGWGAACPGSGWHSPAAPAASGQVGAFLLPAPCDLGLLLCL